MTPEGSLMYRSNPLDALSRSSAFGWRYWLSTPDGELLSPVRESINPHYGNEKWSESTVWATCVHGHTRPDPQCSCGIYYVDSGACTYFRDPETHDGLNRVRFAPPGTLSPIVFTYGEGIGTRIRDVHHPRETYGGRQAMRAAGYTVRGFFIPERSPGENAQALIKRFRVPFEVGSGGLNDLAKLEGLAIKCRSFTVR